MAIFMSGGGYRGPKEIEYLFVDGASLHGRIESLSRRFLGRQVFEVDFQKLKAGYTKCFYYDAIPVRNDGEAESEYLDRTRIQRERHQLAATVDGVHVYEGDARLRRKKHEQKKVDVMIAVDLMHHTFRRNMHRATLLTGDGDFKPLVDAVVREGMEVRLWYPPGETSQELLDAADTRLPLGIQALKNILADSSLKAFDLPVAESHSPQHLSGEVVKSWGKPDEAQQELRLDGEEFIVGRYWDANNYYCVRHKNPEVLKVVCADYPQFYSLPGDLFGA